MSFEWFVALRYLRAGRKQAFISLITCISILGVAVGVMALIVVIAVMAGFQDHLRTKILGINSHILVRHYYGPFDNPDKIGKKIMSVRVKRPGVLGNFLNDVLGEKDGVHVTALTPFVNIQALLSSGTRVSGAVIRGVDPDTVTKVINIGDIIDGEGISALKKYGKNGRRIPGIILGKEMARTLGVSVGQSIHVVLPSGTISPVGMLPKIRPFRVIGITTTGVYEYDASFAFISIHAAQKLLGIGNRVQGFELKVSDIYAADRLSQAIQKALGFPFWTIDWQHMSRNLFSALKLEKLAMFIVLTLIVLVAAFNIISTLIMMVMEKKQDIAILKALGASDRKILRIFMYNGITIGLIGTLMGTVGGIGLCWALSRYKFIKIPADVYYTSTLPILLHTSDVLAISISTMIICFCATIYPARQAAKINPSEALRNS